MKKLELRIEELDSQRVAGDWTDFWTGVGVGIGIGAIVLTGFLAT